jgi:plastocyanin
VVFFEGTAPLRKPIAVESVGGCKSEHEVLTEQVIVNDGRLQNVFVYVKRGLEGWIVPPAPSTQALLVQKGCVYQPHVQGIRVGQTLQIKNSDPASHNVNARPRRRENESFNQLQPMNGADLSRVFGEQEVAIRFECNIHPWMNAYVAVVDHPFFTVSAADGSFELSGLPPGEYELEAWHEQYKRASAQVTVVGGQAAEAAFTFSP